MCCQCIFYDTSYTMIMLPYTSLLFTECNVLQYKHVYTASGLRAGCPRPGPGRVGMPDTYIHHYWRVG